MAQEDPRSTGNVFERSGRRLDEKLSDAIPRIEADVQRVVKYINDEVVPQVRRESSEALRSAAEQLRKLADYMEAKRKQR